MQDIKLTCAPCPVCAMQVKLLRQADRTLELLEVDEAKYADELSLQQKEFASSVNTLAAVRFQQPFETVMGCIRQQRLESCMYNSTHMLAVVILLQVCRKACMRHKGRP